MRRPSGVLHRNVLEIGIGRRQTPRRCRGERIGCVHAARLGIDVAGQCIRIGRAQFRNLPPVEHFSRQLDALRGQILEHVRIGTPRAGLRLAAAGQAHAAEENVAKLLGRADIEALAGKLVDLGFDLGRIAREFIRKPAPTPRDRPARRAFPCRAAPAPVGRSNVS